MLSAQYQPGPEVPSQHRLGKRRNNVVSEHEDQGSNELDNHVLTFHYPILNYGRQVVFGSDQGFSIDMKLVVGSYVNSISFIISFSNRMFRYLDLLPLPLVCKVNTKKYSLNTA